MCHEGLCVGEATCTMAMEIRAYVSFLWFSFIVGFIVLYIVLQTVGDVVCMTGNVLPSVFT